MYQKKAEGFEKELVVAKQQNKRLKAKVENLRNQLEQNVSFTFWWISNIVDLAVIKNQRMFVVLRTTSNAKQLFKSGVAYCLPGS